MRSTFAILCTLGLIALGSNAWAAAGWELPVTVSAGRAVQHLSLGERTDATDGVDGLYDVPALPGGTLRAGFSLAGGHYWRDVRPLAKGHQRWKLIVTSSAGADVTVAWGHFPRRFRLQARLKDPVAGRIIDAIKHRRYRFRNGGRRTLIFDIAWQGGLP